MWTVETLNDVVTAELEALPDDILIKFTRIGMLFQLFGVEGVRWPNVDHLEGPLWEMRMKGGDGIARALYVAVSGKRIVVVRAFVKKTQKTPRREIELALERAKEVL